MTEVSQDERTRRQIAHFTAARRLVDGMKEHPEARAGLGRALDFHTAKARALASELCGRRDWHPAAAQQ